VLTEDAVRRLERSIAGDPKLLVAKLADAINRAMTLTDSEKLRVAFHEYHDPLRFRSQLADLLALFQ